MKVIGESPYYTIMNFDLGLKDTAKFLDCFVSSDESILFPYFEVNLKNDEKDWKEFILSRTIFKSENWSFQGSTHKNVYWIRPENEQDLIKILEYPGMNYLLYTVSSENDLEHYKFLIYVVEHVIDDSTDENDECLAMLITEGNNGIFEKHILPKLLKSFTNLRSLLS
jgi:hypothetical protein